MRKFVTSAAIGAVLIGGAASLAMPAYAQSQGSDQAPAQTQQDQGKAKVRDNKGRRHRVIKAAVKISAETIGISPQDLVKELRNGKSVAEVATEHGKTAQEVIDALVSKASSKVDELVAAGKIDAEMGERIKAKAPEAAARLVNAHRQPKADQGNAEQPQN